MPAVSSAGRCVPPDEKHTAHHVQPLRKPTLQDSSQVCPQVLPHNRVECLPQQDVKAARGTGRLCGAAAPRSKP